jgi:hypothetical protein
MEDIMLAALARGAALGALAVLWPSMCLAWGNEGHKTVALTAAKILSTEAPATLAKVNAILAKDKPDAWHGVNVPVAPDIGNEATWADLLREQSKTGREVTESWHFVDIDFDQPNLDQPCAGHPKLSAGQVASQAPSPDCVIDKIDQFTSELKNRQTSDNERLLALKFLLHFVGDIHQPLHAATRTDPQIGHEDFGGNCVGVLRGNDRDPIRLHSYWDTNLVVAAVGQDENQAVTELMPLITASSEKEWAKGTPADWAQESYGLAKSSVYAGVIDKAPVQTDFVFKGRDGKPDERCGKSKVYKIDPGYDQQSIKVVKEQLAKAAVRLAWLLKENLQ